VRVLLGSPFEAGAATSAVDILFRTAALELLFGRDFEFGERTEGVSFVELETGIGREIDDEVVAVMLGVHGTWKA
jgi:hypothetical protein